MRRANYQPALKEKNNFDKDSPIQIIPVDVIRMILSYLSPADWKSASLVCSFWKEQANHRYVRARVGSNFYAHFLKNISGVLSSLDSFIDKEELLRLFEDRVIPIPVKVATLLDIKHYISYLPPGFYLSEESEYHGALSLGKKFCPLTSEKLVTCKESLTADPAAYAPLLSIIDALVEKLILVFRFFSQEQIGANEEFLEVYEAYISKNAILELGSRAAMLREQRGLLENSAKTSGNLKPLNELAEKVNPIFMETISKNQVRRQCAWFLRIRSLETKLLLIAVPVFALVMLGTGAYVIDRAAEDNSVGKGVGGAMVGVSSLMILAMLVTLYGHIRAYYNTREAANNLLESNRSGRAPANNDVIVEMGAPGENTPFLQAVQTKRSGAPSDESLQFSL